ncbi:hypothetical protein LCI18_014742 [Fusarium solani-melongenae]|uniref:Uncharacterized protein n=1 Tax=Fusarium solani subsp. cucurbitae TaxID=2747967 RepID=A0ACD3ZRP9_FUSSC|nr:hypothetical protein LCI18_014742 [Fusarium solani-melongenae]
METESKPSEMGTPRSSSLSSLSDSDSDSETAKNLQRRSNDSDSQTNNEDKIEWLATTRKRRSTAGNRMKSMLANEEPDSDLELLFAEDENDQGFSDVDENASDVHMDSSSDDEDNDNNDDDLEGEKELERQAKERRTAQRKRKAQEAIPAKFRKKVRIDPTTKTPAAPTRPPPRPKKKSERTSWLPSPADLPTRASSRQTTRLSKEQLHQQMVEREARRLKQVAQMQKKAARLEAMKKPPMTQEERLREAAIVEKRNSKSLNRWEVAEKQREEERRAKLAALHQRTLKGPVITFWSGIGEWMGRHMVIEEPAKEKRKRGEKAKGKDKDKSKDQDKTPAGAPNPPEAEPQPPQPSTGARNAMVFQNFDNNALKDRTIQTQIIFGRKMNKLPKPSPAPLCVITNHPARYRDPRTGLPYYNAYAYREIQRLIRNEYRWSCALNAWVGSGTYAARGVPERFLNPNGKGPEKKEPAVGDETKGETAKTTDAAPAPKGPDGSTGTQVPENKVNTVKDEPKPSPISQPDTAKATAQVNTAAPGSLAQPPAAGPSTSISAPAPVPASAPVLTPPTFAPPASAAAPPPQPQLQAPTNPPPTAAGTAPTPAQEAK